MCETYHSAKAMERYITRFKQILMCYRKGMKLDKIAFSVNCTQKLVQEYLNIIEEYKEKDYILDQMAEEVETVIERTTHSMTE